jgi:hypothetical protein
LLELKQQEQNTIENKNRIIAAIVPSIVISFINRCGVAVQDLCLAVSYACCFSFFRLIIYCYMFVNDYGRRIFLGITQVQRSVTVLSEPQPMKNRFSVNFALISIFSALWVVLNLTVAPLGFAIFHLPVVHSLIIFFMLVLVTWATGQYGAASAISIIGSLIVVLANPQVLPVLGFVPASLIFDLILLVNHHKINLKAVNVAVVGFASIVCAYIAAVVNGIVILNLALMFTLTVWATWNVLGGVIGVAITLPLIRVLEKAQVKRVKTA